MHIFLRNNTHSLQDVISKWWTRLYKPTSNFYLILDIWQSLRFLQVCYVTSQCLKSRRIQIWMIILIWFYLHNVVGCNLSYENFGEETKPETVYWTGSASSNTECRELCSSDINCAGYGYIYELDQCTKSNSTSVKSSNKDESHFYKKKCDSGTSRNLFKTKETGLFPILPTWKWKLKIAKCFIFELSAEITFNILNHIWKKKKCIFKIISSFKDPDPNWILRPILPYLFAESPSTEFGVSLCLLKKLYILNTSSLFGKDACYFCKVVYLKKYVDLR